MQHQAGSAGTAVTRFSYASDTSTLVVDPRSEQSTVRERCWWPADPDHQHLLHVLVVVDIDSCVWVPQAFSLTRRPIIGEPEVR